MTILDQTTFLTIGTNPLNEIKTITSHNSLYAMTNGIGGVIKGNSSWGMDAWDCAGPKKPEYDVTYNYYKNYTCHYTDERYSLIEVVDEEYSTHCPKDKQSSYAMIEIDEYEGEMIKLISFSSKELVVDAIRDLKLSKKSKGIDHNDTPFDIFYDGECLACEHYCGIIMLFLEINNKK